MLAECPRHEHLTVLDFPKKLQKPIQQRRSQKQKNNQLDCYDL